MGFPGRCVWKGSIFSRHQLLMLQNRCAWTTAVLQLGTGQCSCTRCWKGRVCSLAIFWSGRFDDSLEQMQCTKSRWRQILTELTLVTGVICYQLCSNCSLPFSWGKSWSSEQGRMSPWGAVLLKPTWNSTSVSLGHCLQHRCRRASIALSMATSLFPTLQKFMKGQSRKEAVDFCWTWGNLRLMHSNCRAWKLLLLLPLNTS